MTNRSINCPCKYSRKAMHKNAKETKINYCRFFLTFRNILHLKNCQNVYFKLELSPQHFHGGSMNGVCCRRLLDNLDIIFRKTKRMHEGGNPTGINRVEESEPDSQEPRISGFHGKHGYAWIPPEPCDRGFTLSAPCCVITGAAIASHTSQFNQPCQLRVSC